MGGARPSRRDRRRRPRVVAALRARWRLAAALAVTTALASGLALAVATAASMAPLPPTLAPDPAAAARARILDRRGEPLAVTRENRWNLNDQEPLHEMPPLQVNAFVAAEDQRFHRHDGVDWRARLHALWQNLRAGRVVRGASTIGEQVAGLLTPRPRGPWSRWLEGFESQRLERRFGKGAVLELYLNQVPYAARRRGVAQAARYYFDRDLDTLDPAECLALAALVRSPGRLDPRRAGGVPPTPLERAVERLARRMGERGLLSEEQAAAARRPLTLAEPAPLLAAPHFVLEVRRRLVEAGAGPVARATTSLDPALQRRAQALLDHQIDVLRGAGVSDGAALVVDHQTDEILAWVNAGSFYSSRDGSQIDAVLAARQPGSTLKPFLYAAALERGWTAATVLRDEPFAGPVGRGLHAYRNYSRRYYGRVRLRDALGNSLNVPAARVAKEVTPAVLYRVLRRFGFDSLGRHPEVYGEGLALGNGEVTLYELVGAYAALARGGVLEPLVALPELEPRGPGVRVMGAEESALIADILADPEARRLEFGTGGVLELPVETAVKTGTSNDYRDAWAVGFSDRHTVGVWMGNLDRREMEGITGSRGPALVLRGIFAELRRGRPSRPLARPRTLVRAPICRETGLAPGDGCPRVEEWFRPGRAPIEPCPEHGRPAGPSPPARPAADPLVRLLQPTPGLDLAMDPRIPDELEAFPFEIETPSPPAGVHWLVDGEVVARTGDGVTTWLWELAPGEHRVRARVWMAGRDAPVETAEIAYRVR
ncbi:MAG: transglycosylase domain-containing protein [Thermoanaerobaculia bacterium]|nr:transglycosylase domain-containing protein [Thermoanaerobaculia bacterium]